MSLNIKKTVLTVLFGTIISTTSVAQMIYHRGNTADPETLDHHKTSSVYEANIINDLYEGLVAYDAQARIVPGVAKSWVVSDDGLSYTFMLRDNAKWSNGDPVNAGDFVYSFRRIMNPETGASYANILYPIKNAQAVNKGEAQLEALAVTAVDTLTLTIELESVTPYFLELLAHQTGKPVHQVSIEQHGSDFVRPGSLISNGAYVLSEFVPNSHIKIVKNLQYYDAENVKIDAVYFYPTEDRGAAVQRFQAGELHSNNDAPTEQIQFMREELGEQFRVAPYLGTYYYAIKSDKAPFSDPRVRRAMSMAVDREFIGEEIWGGTMLPAYSFVPPGISNYGKPAYADYKDLDQLDREDAAIALLDEAGFNESNPLKIEIRYNTSENHKNTAIAIADNWSAVGIETTFLNTDAKTHFAHMRDNGDFDVARAGWIGDYSDPQNFLFMVESDNEGFNYANYNNPEYDRLMNSAASETDLQARTELLAQAESIFMDDLPFLPLLYYSSLSLVSNKLKGWEDNLLNVHLSRYMSVEE